MNTVVTQKYNEGYTYYGDLGVSTQGKTPTRVRQTAARVLG